eukprot:3194694-Amphidinium_carterae.1
MPVSPSSPALNTTSIQMRSYTTLSSQLRLVPVDRLNSPGAPNISRLFAAVPKLDNNSRNIGTNPSRANSMC